MENIQPKQDMLRQRRMIDAYDAERIRSAVAPTLAPPPEDADEQTKAQYQAKLNKLKPFLFKEGFGTRTKIKMPPELHKLFVERKEIGTFLKAAGLSYRDLLTICAGGIPVTWGCPWESKMADLCDSSTPNNCEAIAHFIENLLPKTVLPLLALRAERDDLLWDNPKYSSTYMLFKTAERTILRQARYSSNNPITVEIAKNIIAEAKQNAAKGTLSADQNSAAYLNGLAKQYENGITSIAELPFHLYPFILKVSQLSPHWLMGLEDEELVLCKTPCAEKVMDRFCLLDSASRKLVYLAAATATAERGIR